MTSFPQIVVAEVEQQNRLKAETERVGPAQVSREG
jgi:hypothetical protein